MLSGTGIVGETALFSEYSCIYNAEKRMLNIQFSMKFEYWILNIQVYTLGRLVLSKVSCWVAKQWFGGTAFFSEYSCIYNFETTILNIQYSMKCEYWILNIRVYNWLRPVLSKVSCWVAQEWLERLRCFLNTHVFIILKIECWTFNIQWNVNIEYWIFRCIL